MTLEKIDALKGIRYNDNIFIAAGVANTHKNELLQLSYLYTYILYVVRGLAAAEYSVMTSTYHDLFAKDQEVCKLNWQEHMNKTTMITITNVDSWDWIKKYKWNQYRCVWCSSTAPCRQRQTGRLSLTSCSIGNMKKYLGEIAAKSTCDDDEITPHNVHSHVVDLSVNFLSNQTKCGLSNEDSHDQRNDKYWNVDRLHGRAIFSCETCGDTKQFRLIGDKRCLLFILRVVSSFELEFMQSS